MRWTVRWPAVDPDDHHVFVSLGCATENLAQAALAHGRDAEVWFDPARDAVRVTLDATSPVASPLFDAITSRQCTRGDYDGKPLSSMELALLERAGTSNGVRLMLLTGRPAMERVLEATTLGIRNALLNQPLEVPSARPRFAASLGLAGSRPDLVVRFGRGPTLPPSLRRPVEAVLV